MGVYLEAYHRLVTEQLLQKHEAQERIVHTIDEFLMGKRAGIWRRSKFGIYLHGSVGSGKSMLMNLAATVDGSQPIRYHFLQFMQQLRLDIREGKGDIRNAVSKYSSRLLLLDEFQVNDIADAMILRSVLVALDSQRVRMICTSNRPPDELYLNGVQRRSFLPCIDYIKSRMHVLSLVTDDHRKAILAKDSHFYHPINEETLNKVMDVYNSFGEIDKEQVLDILGRKLVIRNTRGLCALLDASFLGRCGPGDYLCLSSAFKALCITGIERVRCRDMARRFIDFIDAAYDHGVVLVLQMECHIDGLFAIDGSSVEWGEEGHAYHRTASRLHEMQYWAIK